MHDERQRVGRAGGLDQVRSPAAGDSGLRVARTFTVNTMSSAVKRRPVVPLHVRPQPPRRVHRPVGIEPPGAISREICSVASWGWYSPSRVLDDEGIQGNGRNVRDPAEPEAASEAIEVGRLLLDADYERLLECGLGVPGPPCPVGASVDEGPHAASTTTSTRKAMLRRAIPTHYPMRRLGGMVGRAADRVDPGLELDFRVGLAYARARTTPSRPTNYEGWPMPKMSTSAEVYARIGVGWAGSYVMTRAFARALPGEPAVAVVADMLNRLDLVAAGELDLTWVFPMAR